MTTSTNTNSRKCTFRPWCGLRDDHHGDCRPIVKTRLEPRHPALNELLSWLPEWFITGIFLFGALVAGGLLSVGCLLISVAAVVWIVVSRTLVRRRSEQILRDYDQNHELTAADAELLDNESDRERGREL